MMGLVYDQRLESNIFKYFGKLSKSLCRATSVYIIIQIIVRMVAALFFVDLF